MAGDIGEARDLSAVCRLLRFVQRLQCLECWRFVGVGLGDLEFPLARIAKDRFASRALHDPERWRLGERDTIGQAVGRLMMARRYGRIINMSSQAGFIALPGEAIYCMTKAGIAHLTKCLAVEWGKYNINVTAVAPTFITTPGTDDFLADPVHRADRRGRGGSQPGCRLPRASRGGWLPQVLCGALSHVGNRPL